MPNIKIFFYIVIALTISPMVKSIFSYPVLTNTNQQFNTYTIDFRGIDTAPGTYWALCNYALDITDFKKTHLNVTGGGAYGGLQILSNGERVAIMSFWKISYIENGETKELKFNRVYPEGKEFYFSGEGEGTNYRAPYNWTTGDWYRFIIHTWEDYNTKEIYIGQWIQDLSTKEWTLFAYFNTHLKNSFISNRKRLSFFEEIFNRRYIKEERSFQLKNMYVFDRIFNQWISINTSYLYFNEQPEIIKEISHTQFYFFGGSTPRTEGLNNVVHKNRFYGSISQSKTPNFIKPIYKKFNVTLTRPKLIIEWEIDSKTCPCYQFSYSIEELSELGYNLMFYDKVSNPEKNIISLLSTFEGTYRITLNGTALSNEIVTEQVIKSI